ncbi:hypothetical protein FC764_03845 [Clostridium botulinum]|nr:hypothetical protein [Clostridium botulinum]
MENFYYKHYITLNEDNIIIDGFSDAFKEPSINDICINDKGERQFKINNITNPNLIDMNGKSIYKYENGNVITQ